MKTPNRWTHLLAEAANLQEPNTRKKLMLGMPHFVEIPKAPANNAPRVHPQDKTWANWDNWVRDIMRSILTVHLSLIKDLSLEGLQVPHADTILESTFALAAALSKNLELHRLKTVDTRLLPPRPEAGALISKEDLAILDRTSKLEKTLGKGKSKGKSYYPKYQPYSSQSWHGRGKSYGYQKGGSYKGAGKGKGKFTFKSDPKERES